MSASGSTDNPKQFPAALLEEQEAIVEGNHGEPTVLGPPPFSSPDPATDGKKMLPLEDGTSAHQARLDVEESRQTDDNDYDSMSPENLKSLAEERGLTVEGTGANGRVLKKDYAAALREDDTADMRAADFIDKVKSAESQEELDEAAQLYEDSGKSYTTVEAAIERKQAELDDEGNGN